MFTLTDTSISDSTWRTFLLMLIDSFHCHQDIKMQFKLSYWSIQWLSVLASALLSTISYSLHSKQDCIPVGCVLPAC